MDLRLDLRCGNISSEIGKMNNEATRKVLEESPVYRSYASLGLPPQLILKLLEAKLHTAKDVLSRMEVDLMILLDLGLGEVRELVQLLSTHMAPRGSSVWNLFFFFEEISWLLCFRLCRYWTKESRNYSNSCPHLLPHLTSTSMEASLQVQSLRYHFLS